MTEQNPGPGTWALVRLSAVLAGRDEEALRRALAVAASAASPEEVEEAILQSYLFLGYPVALNAFALWRRVAGPESPSAVSDDWIGWAERGEAVCRTVYGGQYDRLRRNVRALHPDMERWMVVEGYGKVLGRPGLSLTTRELCILALLVVLDAPRQLYSHMRGALNAGATPGDIDKALALAFLVAGPAQEREARSVWSRVKERSGTEAGQQRGDTVVPPQTSLKE